MKLSIKNKTINFFAISAVLALGACAEQRATTHTGLNITSEPVPAASLFFDNFAPTPNAISDFKFCVTQFKMVTDGVEGDATEAILGLVDLGSDAAVSWGNIDLTSSVTVDEIHFEIHRDPENCSSADYSINYKGEVLSQDLEFKFEFVPALTLTSGDTLSLTLGDIATQLEAAYDANAFTNEDISTYLQTTTKGSGSKE